MELRDLKLFQAIVEEGSITRAADRLGYVQSNVTARLRRLEEELGVLLFHRTSKGVQITEKGMTFRPYVDSILKMAEEAVRDLKDDGAPAGTLRIGVVETVTCGNFMNVISAYQSEYEAVSLRLETGNTAELIQKLRNYELDAAFVTGDLTDANLAIDYMETDEIVLLSGKPLNMNHSLPLMQNWAVSPIGCPFRNKLEQWHQDEGKTLNRMIEISSLETLLGSVKAGLTSTLLPKSVLTDGYEQLYVYPIPEPYRWIETGLVRRKEAFTSFAYKAFADLVKEEGL